MRYIIGVSCSDSDTIGILRFEGTEDQVKRYLYDLVLEDRAEADPDGWDYGTESLEDVYKEGRSFYAYAGYGDYHINYQAVPEEDTPLLKKEE